MLRLGLDYHANVQNALVHLYSSRASSIACARVLFDRIPEKTVVTFNSMISGFVRNKHFSAGLGLFNGLCCSFDHGCMKLKPNHVTLVILISGCQEFSDFVAGKSLQSYGHSTGLSSWTEVSNALIDLYGRFGCVEEARRVFDEMSERDLVSWNTLIAGYAKSNDCKRALSLFREMRNGNIECDRVTLISLMLAAANSGDLESAKVLHGYVKARGLESSIAVGTALMNMYSKCRAVGFARNVFHELPDSCIASWNAMIFAYLESRCYTEGLRLFIQAIQSKKLKPDEITLLGSILACRNSSQLRHGIHIHSYIEKSDFNRSILLCNALIDMYAKCGSMEHAKSVFNMMPKKDVISWTSIIIGHAINGSGEEALIAFQHMREQKIEPNSVTFIGVLSACDHAGLVKDGRELYDVMCELYHIKPDIEHYGCMVDMLARAGMLDEAFKFVKEMSVEPNAVVWRMLMNGCRVHGNFDMGTNLVGWLLDGNTMQGPEDHVLSSNIFAGAGKWDDVVQARGLIVAQEASKLAGKSFISDPIG